jgi:hypothetical protein
VCKSWGQTPDWFFSLDEHTQSGILAEYRLSQLGQEDFEKRQKIAKKSEVKWKRERSNVGVKWERR